MADQHHSGKHGHEHKHEKPRGFHKDWRLWTVVVLMLAAMAIYILSDNEALVPGEPEQPQVPAAAE